MPLNPFPSLEAVRTAWESQAPAEWRRLRRIIRGPKPFLSIYSPQWTMREDDHQRQEIREELMKWTVSFFLARSYHVQCLPRTNCTDSFVIEPVEPYSPYLLHPI